ncbi:MAG: 2-amino-4-hydroxy-6-hydroxymethyldihydropteridine diphosphokinase [Planctomycetota bacterium]|jgi:2-amino-4-hydroxy-6-hydroxymethyldihydropteridine diphosphokinase
MTTSATAYIALGGNLGDRAAILAAAVQRIGELDGVTVTKQSSMIETDPVGPAGQPDYLNGCIEIETTLSARELLARLQEIETALGRDRRGEPRWGARSCDLDILLMGELIVDTPELTIPHPRLHERAFALQPLAEIAPGAMHPGFGKSAAQLLAELEPTE